MWESYIVAVENVIYKSIRPSYHCKIMVDGIWENTVCKWLQIHYLISQYTIWAYSKVNILHLRKMTFIDNTPSGSTSFAILRASELARSVFAGDIARMRQFSRLMNSISMLRICISMSGGWSPTATFVMPGRSISVRFNTVTQTEKQ